MVLQVFTYAWVLAVIALTLFLVFAMFQLVYMKLTGKPIQWVQTYSLKWIPKFAIQSTLVAVAISGAIYWSTESTDAAVSIFVFMMACIIAGLIKSAQIETHIKRRGGKKV